MSAPLLPSDYESVELSLAQHHLTMFVDKFVSRSRKARWKGLIRKDSSVLYSKLRRLREDLDMNMCTEIDSITEDERGVCLDFFHYPHWLIGKDILKLHRNCIVSVDPGKKAYFVTDNNTIWLCETRNRNLKKGKGAGADK